MLLFEEGEEDDRRYICGRISLQVPYGTNFLLRGEKVFVCSMVMNTKNSPLQEKRKVKSSSENMTYKIIRISALFTLISGMRMKS